MTEHKDTNTKAMQEPLIATNVQPVGVEDKPASTAPAPSEQLASQDQVRGAAWAGGISGLLIGGPVGALLFAWGSVHLAKKSAGDVGQFCRKSGDFMCRIGNTAQKEWNESRGDMKH